MWRSWSLVKVTCSRTMPNKSACSPLESNSLISFRIFFCFGACLLSLGVCVLSTSITITREVKMGTKREWQPHAKWLVFKAAKASRTPVKRQKEKAEVLRPRPDFLYRLSRRSGIHWSSSMTTISPFSWMYGTFRSMFISSATCCKAQTMGWVRSRIKNSIR